MIECGVACLVSNLQKKCEVVFYPHVLERRVKTKRNVGHFSILP